ncbi:unnamed protein product, partial [Symbiodinium sp. KB8]
MTPIAHAGMHRSKFRLKLATNPAVVEKYMEAIEGGRKGGATSDDLQELVQAIVRILTAFPPDQTTAALERVLTPTMMAIQNLVKQPMEFDTVDALVKEVNMAGTALRFADLPRPDGA